MSFLVMTILCGILYPLSITGIAQLVFPSQANGSMIKVTQADGSDQVVGSALIGQTFTMPQYLIGRPAGVSNLSVVSNEEAKRIEEQVNKFHELDASNGDDIPSDLVMASGSGVDPNISVDAAMYQVARIASTRQVDEDVVRNIINDNTSKRLMGFFGEPGVNVLKVNISLDRLK